MNGDRLVRIPGPNPDDIPRFLIIQHEQNYIAYFRFDLPSSLWMPLTAISFERAFHDHQLVKALFS